MSGDFVYLASGSPRRRDLLQQIGVRYRILGASVDESARSGEAAVQYVMRLAAAKADAGWSLPREDLRAPVLAADTTVVLDGAILGKPRSREDFAHMLAQLGGRAHEVLTAVALRTERGVMVRLSASRVEFRHIGADEIQRYWSTGEPCDKAGGYAIQGLGAVFVASLAGSYSGVMGLPLLETAALLDAAGVPRWDLPMVPAGAAR